MIKILTNKDFEFPANPKSNVIRGDKVVVFNFNEQNISGDSAVEITKKGYAIVETVSPDFGDGNIYI